MPERIPINLRKTITELVSGITALDADNIIGMYLTGSIALKDFHSGKSDVDLLVVCKRFPNDKLQLRIQKVHRRIGKKLEGSDLNGCYITTDALDIGRAQATKTVCFHEGKMSVSGFEMAPVALYELKTTAVTIFGIPAKELPVTIGIEDVNAFLFTNINTYWISWLRKFDGRRLLLILFPRLTEWILLGVARQLYTLRTGTITSKTNAGYYCLNLLPDQYRSILQRAMDIRNDKTKHALRMRSSYYIRPSIKRARETLFCAGYIIQLFNEAYRKKI